jgi:hypothetical protein
MSRKGSQIYRLYLNELFAALSKKYNADATIDWRKWERLERELRGR